MAARCMELLGTQAVLVNLQGIDIRAICQGCLQCGAHFKCAFEGKDGFVDFLRSTIMTADILIYAGTFINRYLSSKWKTFFDRSFFNTHTPMLAGKQVDFLISRPLSQEANLQEILCGYFEFQMANLVGFVSDETGSSADIDRIVDSMIARAVLYALQGCARPMIFLAVGGLKIFRNDIWGAAIRVSSRPPHFQKA
jgi:multimeric flavodoxin WrbA